MAKVPFSVYHHLTHQHHNGAEEQEPQPLSTESVCGKGMAEEQKGSGQKDRTMLSVTEKLPQWLSVATCKMGEASRR